MKANILVPNNNNLKAAEKNVKKTTAVLKVYQRARDTDPNLQSTAMDNRTKLPLSINADPRTKN